jgi:hypothetical protein
MEQGLEPEQSSAEQWERIFGTKESAVANLQKLVAVLSHISEHLAAQQDPITAEWDRTLSDEDYAMLARWLEKERTTRPAQ